MTAPRPPLFYPFVAPPEQEGANPPAFYAALGSTAAVTGQSDGGLVITITNPATLYTPDDTAQPLATVVTPTRGYATFYPAGDPLPTPGGQPLLPPPGVVAADVGSVVLRIWGLDYKKLGTTLPAGALRPTHIILGGIRCSDAETAFKGPISKLSMKVLRKAWQGTGPAPDDRPTLEGAYLVQVMAHSAEVFVDAGDSVGVATSYADTVAGATLGWMAWHAFARDKDTDPPMAVDAMALLDDIFTRTEADQVGSIYEGHPLVEATSAEHSVTFQCRLMIWDNTTVPKGYVPYANCPASLLRNGVAVGAPYTTDNNGYVSFTAQLSARDTIAFKYEDSTLPGGIESEPRKVGTAAVADPFYGRYHVYERYRAFRERLWDNEDEEAFGPDRGNSSRKMITRHQENVRLHLLRDSERKYAKNKNTASEFNVLYEGDSWLFYPFSTDIFEWLHNCIQDRIEQPYRYNAFPLQYFGDRTDQMFGAVAPCVVPQPPPSNAERQWDFTERYLSDLPIDLIVLSGGGNDIAEPGISDSPTNKARYPNLFDAQGCFLPHLASQPVNLAPAKFDVARNQMFRSFSIMLRNHPWNVYERSGTQKSVAQIDQDFANHFTYFDSIGRSFEGIDRKAMALAVLYGFPDGRNFPYSIVDEFDQFLDEAYDTPRVAARLTDMKTNIAKLLADAQSCGVKVLGHSYAYPFFNELATWVNPENEFILCTGPWFANRFKQANINDPRIKLICLKGLLDCIFDHVLRPLKTQYPGTFDFVDVRETVVDAQYWRDEMHLTDSGFDRVASPIYDRMVTMFPAVLS